MKITQVEVSLYDLMPERPRHDAIQAFVKQETILVDITTADGLTGTGYAYTIGTGGRAILELLRHNLIPLLIGEDARQIEAIWQKLFWFTHGTAVGPITSLALAAVDTALWDLRGKALGQPLWLLAGGAQRQVPLYDTEGGWLQLSTEELVEGARQSRAQGWPGVKIKVGKPDPSEDLERLQAVREAVGPRMHLMIDANQSMTYAEAKRRARLFESVDVYWFEEPLPAEDISGHRLLAQSTSIPIAVGESLYSASHFREYLATGAAGIVQADVARVGGITPWLKIAHLAESFNVKIAPHFLMELHVSLAAAVPNALYVEHIPQLRMVTHSQIEVVDGNAVAPSEPGIGIDWDRKAMEALRVMI
ncbi:mandelate racemase/muconate lactonizing enzyme family protein [Ktedonobacter racemifer]|uniref:Mandelate racemase/muconate lactonizing protein n=1 Tax=Ktedonobacter racemifer DSM 44963 TaxID=485913 RepID=D6TGB8_KTERA|nr:mandelate racemase/muconate lactonizing enzyme family protein [Ktedonobacter racemifer]EFH88820.1 Mandelate racemase/muconate lactonizing protein [Ktedonobacter racemifer DSM 44963]